MIHLFLLFKIENATFVENLATMTSIVRSCFCNCVFSLAANSHTHLFDSPQLQIFWVVKDSVKLLWCIVVQEIELVWQLTFYSKVDSMVPSTMVWAPVNGLPLAIRSSRRNPSCPNVPPSKKLPSVKLTMVVVWN